jgi:hypothetical protein
MAFQRIPSAIVGPFVNGQSVVLGANGSKNLGPFYVGGMPSLLIAISSHAANSIWSVTLNWFSSSSLQGLIEQNVFDVGTPVFLNSGVDIGLTITTPVKGPWLVIQIQADATPSTVTATLTQLNYPTQLASVGSNGDAFGGTMLGINIAAGAEASFGFGSWYGPAVLTFEIQNANPFPWQIRATIETVGGGGGRVGEWTQDDFNGAQAVTIPITLYGQPILLEFFNPSTQQMTMGASLNLETTG